MHTCLYTHYIRGEACLHIPPIYTYVHTLIYPLYMAAYGATLPWARAVKGVPGGTHTFICPLAMGILEVNNMYEIYCVCGQVMYNTSPAHTLPREDRICSRCEA